MKLVVLGAPGAGKGTQARNIASYYGIAHIATSDTLREYLSKNNDLHVKETMAKGGLVPDDVIVSLIKERLKADDCAKGFIFDGFPRTLAQANELSELVPNLEHAISIKVADELIIERISGRIICPNCGAMFHSHYYPPKKAETCDVCNTQLVHREDDKKYTVVERLKIYHKMTEPIIQFYRERGILCEVNGVGDAAEITNSIVKQIGENNGYFN